jgi:hypothetical protein
MKLYATTTSERASKGQGGNQFINIDMLVGDKDNQIDAGRICMKTTGDIFWIEYFSPAPAGQKINRIPLFKTETKGKRQKGDNKCASGHLQDDDGRCECTNEDAY